MNEAPNSNAASQTLETDLLIIGAGPAGASLSCFLARYGLKGMTISSASGTSPEPRAHITNSAALECLRDLDMGVHDECVRLGHSGDFIKNFRWCETMAGEEYARVPSWGMHGDRRSDFETVSPCTYLDLPQSLLEPVLIKWATAHGWLVRWDTKLMEFSEEDNDSHDKRILAKVLDQITGVEYTIRTRFLFGADGGRSVVAQQLGLPFTSMPGGALAHNVLVRAEFGHLMPHREGNLHMIPRLDKDYPFVCVARMIKPWGEWMFVFFPKGPGVEIPKYSREEWKAIVSDLIGDSEVAVEVVHMASWMINETSADTISKGNVFCLGDAIHRHPPTLGLGSNTCIQDAFNLSWKIALVHQGLSSSSLLATYNAERQPVAAKLVLDSNNTLRSHAEVWIAMGLQPYGTSERDRRSAKEFLKQDTLKGREARRIFREKVKHMQFETQGLGISMNQLYDSSAVYAGDEEPFRPGSSEQKDPHRFHDPCAYPGRRLPHVWLGTRVPGEMVSTLDITGKGSFTLLTGIGGGGWSKAADCVENVLGVKVNVAGIAIGLEWEDVYFDWEEKSGVEEDGCVLVRPDYFVAWRSMKSEDESTRLLKVMRHILGVSTDVMTAADGTRKDLPSSEDGNAQ